MFFSCFFIVLFLFCFLLFFFIFFCYVIIICIHLFFLFFFIFTCIWARDQGLGDGYLGWEFGMGIWNGHLYFDY